MNFDVMCFDFVNGSLCVVQHEYFDTYEEADDFTNSEEAQQYDSTSITPMNREAEQIIRSRS